MHEQRRRGSGQNQHGNHENRTHGLERTDDDHREHPHQCVVHDCGVDAERRRQAGVKTRHQQFLVENQDQQQRAAGDDGHADD